PRRRRGLLRRQGPGVRPRHGRRRALGDGDRLDPRARLTAPVGAREPAPATPPTRSSVPISYGARYEIGTELRVRGQGQGSGTNRASSTHAPTSPTRTLEPSS